MWIKSISYVLISFPSKAGNISTLTLIFVPWYSTMRCLIVSKSSSINSQIGRKFSLLKNMNYELVVHTALCSRNFQNVKLRLHCFDILRFHCHLDFEWNKILLLLKMPFSPIYRLYILILENLTNFWSPKFSQNSNFSDPKMVKKGNFWGSYFVKIDFTQNWVVIFQFS